MAMNEKDYYEAVQNWFRKEKSCQPLGVDYKFENLRLLTGDIVAQSGPDIYACEIKKYPYPLGSQGYGAIGQALALKRVANYVYVGCIATEISEHITYTWQKASSVATTKKLLDYLGLAVPQSYDSYKEVVRIIFNTFFEDLGIGFLVVHEAKDPLTEEITREVHELVEPEYNQLTK
ncbi:MAG: hypothetical protein JSV33_15035 [bacterium]|nr:MAG: hypothetical protein JSV33_15035 [bacterium]